MKVIKRDGTVVPFDLGKIERAVLACGVTDISGVCCSVVRVLSLSKEYQTVEEISDLVEKYIIDFGFTKEAKAFILYREDRRKKRVPSCKQFDESFISKYPIFEELADRQAIEFYWTHNSIELEQDVPDILTKMDDSQRFAVCYLQKLFTQYEAKLGEDYWSNKFMKIFPRHEFQRWGATASFIELQVHAPFYRKLNEVMSLEVDGFYDEYKEDPVLLERMNYIDEILRNGSDLESIAAFALLEGVVLFSAFAFFKSFQSNGNNLLAKFVSGINFSARDEDLHAQAGSAAFRILKEEINLNDVEEKALKTTIDNVALKLSEHERCIVRKAYNGEEFINGQHYENYYHFIDHRINRVYEMLGYPPLVTEHKDPSSITSWFYDSVESYQITDFFRTKTREYTHKWKKAEFKWNN